MTGFTEALPALRDAVRRDHARYLDDLRALVELETPSSSPHAVGRAADWLQQWVVAMLGQSESHTRHDFGDHGPTLVFDYPGQRPGRVVLLAHYDTVWPLGTIEDIPFSVTDGVIRGPGVLDMKAGLIAGVHAIRHAREHGLALPALTLVCNGDEELGSPASRPIIEAAGEGALAALVLEPGVGWDLKTERKAVGVFELRTTGIESHAGNDPEGGASAVHAIAELIGQVADLNALDEGTSVNVGVVTGGTGRNVVAGSATAKIDTRATQVSEMERVDTALRALRASDPRVGVELLGSWGRPPMRHDETQRPLFERASAIAAAVRAPLGRRSVGGGSDGNFLAARGIPVLDGLGASGAGPHARNEHVLEGDVDDRILLIAGILASVGE
ncbi:M20/M25/M40 family metallo-hydrolase [Microbacterium sp. Marseille-Q6965]|uniref:M20/M25/M40 family metallo-hydrolase n=1 Tax=Microbacterium sp. Marseille-Q6965 TaxID=2965072 RepID=UPI0021B72A5F|nr:M20/M25/M40 family metallo-hydrolase [Microbacterium sp. Marseille-Q6965]